MKLELVSSQTFLSYLIGRTMVAWNLSFELVSYRKMLLPDLCKASLDPRLLSFNEWLSLV